MASGRRRERERVTDDWNVFVDFESVDVHTQYLLGQIVAESKWVG